MDTISLNRYSSRAPDNNVWEPIESPYDLAEFKKLIADVKRAFRNGTKKQKGDSLEVLMTFIYDRFQDAVVHPNISDGDNQIDHLIEFLDVSTPNFIHNYIGLRIIGESKNHSKSIGVREVADLSELLRSKRAKLGIFSSTKGFGKGKKNNYWQYAEGKRRKLALSRNEFIIGFTLKEIEDLDKNNFYTVLRQKFFNLVDEIEDSYTDYLADQHDLPYHERLFSCLEQLKSNEIITDETFNNAKEKLIQKYGPLDIT
ncbi:hypothetical protein [Brevibacillus sp. BC25]|uniref:hypothetical protein n=1 Tax=Brevibacillus sp. BC25 TaxID=1144308 RepID=UPI00027137B3|nr:hypothetical protein [Brevibacillus sp. BC25]EJL30006.1 hypothetical protein PMI05_01622 [Brevibacillus sp. BC25]